MKELHLIKCPRVTNRFHEDLIAIITFTVYYNSLYTVYYYINAF